jgi:hypothetical protein
MKRGSSGGIVMAKRQRQAALERYRLNPNICKGCGQTIEVHANEKVSSVRIKKFCNMSCAAKYNNIHSPKRIKDKTCKGCGSLIIRKRIYCNKCREKNKVKNKKKAAISRGTISQNARSVYVHSGKPKKCFLCGFSSFVEVCHIIPISKFNNESTLDQINKLENLVALCPNHHWELDHGLIELKKEKP